MEFTSNRHWWLVLLLWLLQGQWWAGCANVPKTKPGDNSINDPKGRDRYKNNGGYFSASDIIISTKSGQMTGLVTWENGKVVSKFLGIPYALPPTGLLRFQAPQKHQGWVLKVLDATYGRPACPQNREDWPDWPEAGPYEREKKRREFSEDCLYMNVYVPRNLSEVEHINILSIPVMVFIHGGPFPADGGWLLAQYGDVIVVTLQYRLGVLGYLSSGDSVAQGNFALLDQRMAMHWIWDNIRELGGNSDRITVFGEGSGAISIGYHVISPLSRGLFTRAISQSGTMLTRCCRQPNPKTMLSSLAAELGLCSWQCYNCGCLPEDSGP